MNTFTSAALHTVAMGILALGSLAASAGDTSQPLQRAVRYGDLDLTHEADAKVLYRRIRTAAKEVCPDIEERSIASQIRQRACVRGAVENAVQNVNAPLLSALHEGQVDTRVAAVAAE
ncbi:MAG: UrcA family protein [Steroidobacteraceae bacterium]